MLPHSPLRASSSTGETSWKCFPTGLATQEEEIKAKENEKKAKPIILAA